MTDQITTIETPRLILRAAREDDAEVLYEVFSDPEVMKYWSEPPHPSPARTQAWVSSMATSTQNGVTDFIICLKPGATDTTSTPAPIGKIGIYSAPPSNEIGFLLSRTHWGKGLAREALSHMLSYLFNLAALPQRSSTQNGDTPRCPKAGQLTTISPDELASSQWRYPSITADTDPRNAASIGLLRSCGFKDAAYVERTWEIGGEWLDSLYLRMEREEWVEKQKGLTLTETSR